MLRHGSHVLMLHVDISVVLLLPGVDRAARLSNVDLTYSQEMQHAPGSFGTRSFLTDRSKLEIPPGGRPIVLVFCRNRTLLLRLYIEPT